jgi:hypothetical protein
MDPNMYQKRLSELGEHICATLGFAYSQTAKPSSIALCVQKCNDALDQLIRFYANI